MSTRQDWSPSDNVLEKAHRYRRKGLVVADPEADGVWWVTSEHPPHRDYRVQTDADPATMKATWVSCTCPHGANNGGLARCTHAVAVLMVFKDQHQTGVSRSTNPGRETKK